MRRGCACATGRDRGTARRPPAASLSRRGSMCATLCTPPPSACMSEGATGTVHVHVLRWEQPHDPDPDGTQLRAILEFVCRQTTLSYVFLDWACMPQGERTVQEKAMFKAMLPNINLLYVSATVLVLMDRTYLSRFWVWLRRDANPTRVDHPCQSMCAPVDGTDLLRSPRVPTPTDPIRGVAEHAAALGRRAVQCACGLATMFRGDRLPWQLPAEASGCPRARVGALHRPGRLHEAQLARCDRHESGL